ncbi:hypothetical protein AOX59_10965 [Lentibacillus amyloliquefaciens]|uniref:Uncharacterized protein n=1 Tax=Lentibacillus amyloliquefaciens TaxID=1472767 RepID=A0A0U3W7E5_9BACI|nr:hypothetical protein AOX59_10965 [Lentibacillus amyloliquefaciens]
MLKNSIIIALFFFVGFTISDLIFNEKIQWIDNIGVSVFTFLIYCFWEWSKKPYDWNKNKSAR